ncbi:MAG: cytidine deaminase [Muribaculaceae bacterium]|jgi:cytidine deaminase|nr:cytidine deaminase [Muribaculaceae bacterium]
MKEIEIITTITERSYNELSKDERELVDAARKATAGAYAPYSNFRVGAAILLDNGQIVTGANQENAAFPSGTCAERSACFYAGANYPDARFEMIAISAIGTDGLETAIPTAPCGACRQALLQYENIARRDVPVILAGRQTIYTVPSVKALLPLTFTEF